MSCIEFTVIRGDTFSFGVRWENNEISMADISAISQTAPVQLTVTSHGLPDRWRAAITGAKGMEFLNAQNEPPAAYEYREVMAVDANTLVIPGISSAGRGPYKGDGALVFRTPIDLTGFTYRMQIREEVDGTVIWTSTTGDITYDNTTKIVSVTVADTATELFTFDTAVFDLEATSSLGVRTTIVEGRLLLDKDVTHD
jgi:FctA-like pili component